MVIHDFTASFDAHLTGTGGETVHVAPVSLDAFAVRTPDSREVVEGEPRVIGAVYAKMLLRDRVSHRRSGEVEPHLRRELEHARKKVLVPLADNIVRYE